MSENSNVSFYYEDVPFTLEAEEKVAIWLKSEAKERSFSIGEINYIFCSDDFLLKLNIEHLSHDYYTDILTFPYQNNPIMSDIYISIDRVKDNASGLNIPFEEELHRVMAHGLLHLLGFDDHNDEDIVAMRKAEKEAIDRLNEEK